MDGGEELSEAGNDLRGRANHDDKKVVNVLKPIPGKSQIVENLLLKVPISKPEDNPEMKEKAIGIDLFSCTTSEGDTQDLGSLLSDESRKWGRSDANDAFEEVVTSDAINVTANKWIKANNKMAKVVAWARRMRSKNSGTSLDSHNMDYPVTMGLKQVLAPKMMPKGTDRLDHIKDSVPKQSNPEVSGYDSLLRDYKFKFLDFRTSTDDGIALTDKIGDALDNTDAAKEEDLNTSPSHVGKSAYGDQLLVCVMALMYLARTTLSVTQLS